MAVVPGLWVNEGGQSAAVLAIKHFVSCHPAALEVMLRAKEAGLTLPAYLADLAQEKTGVRPRPFISPAGYT
ncbi:hypothetical protein A8A01_00185 [Ewingella americana]|nr:hypothetical protein A8A01_00185 [Ewingella americana]